MLFALAEIGPGKKLGRVIGAVCNPLADQQEQPSKLSAAFSRVSLEPILTLADGLSEANFELPNQFVCPMLKFDGENLYCKTRFIFVDSHNEYTEASEVSCIHKNIVTQKQTVISSTSSPKS
jgi:hypothetical protein